MSESTEPQLVTMFAALLCFAEHLRGVQVEIEVNFNIAQQFIDFAKKTFPDLLPNQKPKE